MSKRKVIIRFRHIWTVHYELRSQNTITSESFKTEELAWLDLGRTLRQWMSTYPPTAMTDEIVEWLGYKTIKAIKKARDLYEDYEQGPSADRIWVEETRLVLSRTVQ